MRSAIRQPFLKHLAGIAIAVNAGLDPGLSLAELPAKLVNELAEEAAGAEWDVSDRRRLLRLLVSDPRASVRAHVAHAAGAAFEPTNVGARELLALANDPSQRVRQAVAHGLATLLSRACAAERTAIASDWVLSPEPRTRAAVASALGLLAQRVPVVLSDLMLEVLAGDDDAKVRARAANALARTAAHDDSDQAAALRRLADDPDHHVRAIARAALS